MTAAPFSRNQPPTRLEAVSERPRNVQYIGLAVLVCLTQLLLVAKTFPLSEVWSDQPLFHIDGAFHWYSMKLGVNLTTMGSLIGYDPFFAAGHVNGIHYNFSARLPTFLAALFSPGIDEIRLYKTYVFSSAVIAPLALFAAAISLRLAPAEALIAASLGVLMWWVSYLRWYFTAGMVSYVTTCYLAVLFVALIIRCLEGGGNRWTPFGLGLIGAFGFFWHSLFPVPVAIAVSAHVVVNAARLDWPRTLTTLALIAVLSILPNLIWLYPTYLYSEPFAANSTQAVVDGLRIGRELLGIFREDAQGSKAYPLLFLASVWACANRETEKGRRGVWLALLLGAVAIELLAYLGAAIPGVGQIQPNRFAAAGYLLLCVPAARGLSLMGRLALQRGALAWRVLAGATVAAMFLLATVLTWELWREVTPGTQGRYGATPPQVRPLGDNSVWMMDWLKRRTTANARVLFETSFARIHDHAHMAGYYAYATQREFIGGPYPWMHFANSWDRSAFRRPISEIPIERMAEYLSLYNVGAIVVHSDAAKSYFDRMPGIILDAEHGRLRAYLVEGQHSYFIKGAGDVQERGHNRVLIANIKGPELVLKYHYTVGMVTDPPALIQGVFFLDDPQPFVRIVAPPPRLRLYIP